MSDDIFDEEELLEECEDDKDLLARWFEIFERDCEQRVPRIREAIDAGDGDRLMQEAHALKGGTGNFFAKAAFETANQLELMGQNKDLGEAKAVFQTLEFELNRLKQALNTLIHS